MSDIRIQTHMNDGDAYPHTIVWSNGQTEEWYIRKADAQAWALEVAKEAVNRNTSSDTTR